MTHDPSAASRKPRHLSMLHQKVQRALMRRHTTLMVAALCALSLLQIPGARAQAPVADVVDPPDQTYATGLDDIDPAITGSMSMMPLYRAFLPVQANLSDRLPMPGNQ